MSSPFDNLNTIADVARYGIYEELKRTLGPRGFDVDLSNINVRVYKKGQVICKIFLYSKDEQVQFMAQHATTRPRTFKLRVENLRYDDPAFFTKITSVVEDIIAAL